MHHANARSPTWAAPIQWGAPQELPFGERARRQAVDCLGARLSCYMSKVIIENTSRPVFFPELRASKPGEQHGGGQIESPRVAERRATVCGGPFAASGPPLQSSARRPFRSGCLLFLKNQTNGAAEIIECAPLGCLFAWLPLWPCCRSLSLVVPCCRLPSGAARSARAQDTVALATQLPEAARPPHSSGQPCSCSAFSLAHLDEGPTPRRVGRANWATSWRARAGPSICVAIRRAQVACRPCMIYLRAQMGAERSLRATVHSTQSAVHTPQYTVCSAQCAQVRRARLKVRRLQSAFSVQRAVCSVQWAVCSARLCGPPATV